MSLPSIAKLPLNGYEQRNVSALATEQSSAQSLSVMWIYVTMFRMACWRLAFLFGGSLLFVPGTVSAQVTAEKAIDNAKRLFSVPACAESNVSTDITVCGTNGAKFRLPLPIVRPIGERVAGDRPRPSADVALSRECGVHRGQRRCNRKDLRAFGYGGGSVPVSALIMLGRALIDPDTELGPLGGYPIKRDNGE